MSSEESLEDAINRKRKETQLARQATENEAEDRHQRIRWAIQEAESIRDRAESQLVAATDELAKANKTSWLSPERPYVDSGFRSKRQTANFELRWEPCISVILGVDVQEDGASLRLSILCEVTGPESKPNRRLHDNAEAIYTEQSPSVACEWFRKQLKECIVKCAGETA